MNRTSKNKKNKKIVLQKQKNFQKKISKKVLNLKMIFFLFICREDFFDRNL